MTVYIVMLNRDILGVYAKLKDAQDHVDLLSTEYSKDDLRIISCGVRE